MEIGNDDAIWRYQPRLIDLRGWTVIGQPRYTVLAIGGAITGLVTLPLLLLFGLWPGGLYALATGFVGGYLLAPHFTAERPLWAWLGYVRGELVSARYWLRCRRASRRARPVTHRFLQEFR
ncbi:hypothetical protein [Jannaschia sp. R86511]|uniref:hypothetical protein n=1 Tax=Jannaschia sp. R86511 TaxID=3093853 RepID=UPI0036D3670D